MKGEGEERGGKGRGIFPSPLILLLQGLPRLGFPSEISNVTRPNSPHASPRGRDAILDLMAARGRGGGGKGMRGKDVTGRGEVLGGER